MDFTQVYELRDRLRSAAIAGSALLTEDFRLKKAVENVKPLAAAAPVFSKIYELAGQLVAKECENRAGILLDTLSLVDAVICTLASVEVPKGTGEDETPRLAPVEISESGAAIVNAPYSVLSGILEALTTSGSGHYNYLVEMRENNPELFADYRVKPAMVEALGASYSELAQKAEEWICEDRDGYVPLLKKDFNPKGGKEMVRRVRVIDELCGAGENAFYLEQLESADKEVRQALIHALRHCPDNEELLLGMTKTEKGKNKEAAIRALAWYEGNPGTEVRKFLEEYAAKKPESFMEYAAYATSDFSSEMAAQVMMSLINAPEEKKNDKGEPLSSRCVKGLVGKSGERICECYRAGIRYSNDLGYSLIESLFVNPAPELRALAMEMAENENPDVMLHYTGAAVMARLMGEEDCSGWLAARFAAVKDGPRFEKRSLDTELHKVLQWTRFNSGLKQYELLTNLYNSFTERWMPFLRVIHQPVKEKFVPILMQYGDERFDRILEGWIDEKDAELCGRLGEWFYKRALGVKDNYNYIRAMTRCGVTSCKGLIVWYAKTHTGRLYLLRSHINMLPSSNAEKAEELNELLEMVKAKKIRCDISEKDIQTLIEEVS